MTPASSFAVQEGNMSEAGVPPVGSPAVADDPASLCRDRAFQRKIKRDAAARAANTTRKKIEFLFVTISWNSVDDEQLAKDLAESERIDQEDLEKCK
jgi:hypothetical protein